MAVLLLFLKHLCWTSSLAWKRCNQKYNLQVIPRMHGAKQNVAESSESREVKYWSRLRVVVLVFSALDVLSSRESVLFSSPKEGQYLPHRSDIRAVSRVFWSYLRLAQYASMEIVRHSTSVNGWQLYTQIHTVLIESPHWPEFSSFTLWRF